MPYAEGGPATPPVSPDHEELLKSLLEGLKREGVPQGSWLVDIARVRDALHEADSLLMRLADAIVSGLPPLNG